MEFARITSAGSVAPGSSIFGGSHCFFSVTPFPEGVDRVPLADFSFEDLERVAVSNSMDIYTPLPATAGDPPCPAYLCPKTFLIFFEMSKTTSVSLLHYFCTYLRAFASKPRRMFLTVVAFGSTVRFPILSADGTRFSIGIFTDLNAAFPCKGEKLYFNMTKQNVLFSSYIDEFEKLNIENAYIRIDRLLTCFREFMKDLRNPTMCVVSECPDADPTTISNLSKDFLDYSMSVDFFCVTENRTYNLTDFAKATNGCLQNYLECDYETLCCDILRKFREDRGIFTVIDMSYSKSLGYMKILSRGQMSDSHLFRMSKLSTNETIHFFAQFQGTVPQQLVFVLRFLDSNMHCYRRVIPLSCQMMRTDPEALLAAVAVRVAMDGYDPTAGANDLRNIDLSGYDALFKERFGIAIRALPLLQRSPHLSNFVLTGTPSEILQRLSPACLPVGNTEWMTVRSAPFGSTHVIVQYPAHHFLVVLAADETGLCEDIGSILSQIDDKATFSSVGSLEPHRSVEYALIRDTLARLI